MFSTDGIYGDMGLNPILVITDEENNCIMVKANTYHECVKPLL